jgi:hypothetical protein
MSKQVLEWYGYSCGLRFISAVYSDERGFVSLIEQFQANEEEYEDE